LALGISERERTSFGGHFVVDGYLLGYYRISTPAPGCVTEERIENVPVGSQGPAHAQNIPNCAPRFVLVKRGAVSVKQRRTDRIN